MQIRVSPPGAAWSGPGPETERLCLVLMMPVLASAVMRGPMTAQPAMTTMPIRFNLFMTVPYELEYLYPPVVGIAYVQLVMVVQKYSRRQPELAVAGPASADRQKKVTLQVE